MPICPAQTGIRLATFDVDVTPPVGVMMAYDPVKRVDELTLRARGIVLLGSGDPIVLCAVDWIGIANEAHDAFRATLARAAPTTPQRVSVHTLHQHDAPSADFTAERLLQEAGAANLERRDGTFARIALARLASAVRGSLAAAQPITHLGHGEAVRAEGACERIIVTSNIMTDLHRLAPGKKPAIRLGSAKASIVKDNAIAPGFE